MPHILRCPPTFILVCILGFWLNPQASAQSNAPALAGDDVARCLAPLQTPTLDNAVAAVDKLRKLADSQQGPAKAATESVIGLVRNLFYNELTLSRTQEALAGAEQRALDKERAAAAWLRPNAFGTVNRMAHRNELEDAERIRADAKLAITEAQQRLEDSVRAMIAATAAYERAGHTHVRSILQAANRTVLSRALPTSMVQIPAIVASAPPPPPEQPKPEANFFLLGVMGVGALLILGLFLQGLNSDQGF